MTDVRTKINIARFVLIKDRPYYSQGLLPLTFIERPGLATFAVDESYRVYFDPALTWSLEEIKGVLLHELSHLLRDHASRGRALEADPLLWNAAADLAINPNLLADNLILPESALLPHRFGLPTGLLAEDYYGRLMENQTLADTCLGFSRPSCGSCATGEAADYELGDDSDEPGVPPQEAALIRQTVLDTIVSARGTQPADLVRVARPHPSRTDWRRILSRHLRAAVVQVSGSGDYSYAHPSRRQSASPSVILPANRTPLPNVAIVVDTSGSMHQTMLDRVLGETKAILKSVGLRDIPVVACDSDVRTNRRVRRTSEVSLIGGGGTDLRIGIQAALVYKPAIVVVLTDGYTPWPTAPLPGGTKLIVGLIGNSGRRIPSWARVVRIEGEAQ